MKPRAPGSEIDALIAASAHDAKNSLGVVLEHLAGLSERRGDDAELCGEIGEIGRQVGRVNSTLMRILMLYRIGAERYPLDLAKQPVRDTLEETLLAYGSALSTRGLAAELDCPEGLMACYDTSLVGGVVADALHNACRFARSRVLLSAAALGSGVAIRIEDDGAGPGAGASGSERGFTTANTGLGMGFAGLVAQLHRRGEQRGSVSLDGASRYGGARWEMILP
ncbi:MAG: hypothetical protein P4L83_23865 [Nevskia sp.]|nr:hypothetical protein [Nevskia sp.]